MRQKRYQIFSFELQHDITRKTNYILDFWPSTMVERLFVERLFADGQLVKGHYVEVTFHEIYIILH